MSTGAAPLLAVESLRIRARLGRAPRTIVRALDLEVGPGETVGIVGESGSGKSMTARALIGLLPAGLHADGRVAIGDRNLLELGERSLRRIRGRQVALLLQDPFTMLNPLLRVGQQITETVTAGGGRREAVRRLAEVGIHDPAVADRYPFQLSGGMQQRVALARALVIRPRVLLLDEPLAALDRKLREGMRDELRAIQRSVGITTVFVTHDQAEALGLSDRIAVMSRGRVEQLGTPREIYERPATRFVADFIGASTLLRGRAVAADRVAVAGGPPLHVSGSQALTVGAEVELAIRPERIRLADGAGGDLHLAATRQRKAAQRDLHLVRADAQSAPLPDRDLAGAHRASAALVDRDDAARDLADVHRLGSSDLRPLLGSDIARCLRAALPPTLTLAHRSLRGRRARPARRCACTRCTGDTGDRRRCATACGSPYVRLPERGDDAVDIVDAPAPRPSSDVLERRP